MKEEEKLLKLLQVAVENGWKPFNKLQEYIIEKYQSFSIFENIVGNHQSYEDYKEFSLNDLVTNFEEGEVSFIEALCKADENQVIHFNDFILGYEGYGSPYLSASENIELMWNYDNTKQKLRPTSERLEWLFKTFNHLLQ